MCDPDARDHRRIAKGGWHAGKTVKQPDAGATQQRHDVDVEFVEEPGGGFGLLHRAFDAVGHEMDRLSHFPTLHVTLCSRETDSVGAFAWSPPHDVHRGGVVAEPRSRQGITRVMRRLQWPTRGGA